MNHLHLIRQSIIPLWVFRRSFSLLYFSWASSV